MTYNSILDIRRVVVLAGLLFFALPTVATYAEKIDFTKENLSYRYAVNLRSSKAPFNVSDIPQLEAFKSHRLYTTRQKKGDIVWHRLRLGFFPSTKNAQKTLSSLQDAYPEAWVTKISKKERVESAESVVVFERSLINILHATRLRIESKLKEVSKESKEAVEKKLSEISSSMKERRRLSKIREEAGEAMTTGNYARAITLYKQLLDSPEYSERQSVKEFLGLAYEGKGETKRARGIYKEYLSLYPTGEGSERVRKHLKELDTAKQKRPTPLPSAAPGEAIDFSKDNLSYRYAVTLLSSKVPIDLSAIPQLELFQTHLLYTTQPIKGSTAWYRLRLGFFPTQGSAQKALSSLRSSFHDAWVSKVSAKERVRSVQTIVLFKAPVTSVADKPRIKIGEKAASLLKKQPDEVREKTTPEEVQPEPASEKQEKQLEAISVMMKEAEVVMTRGNYSKAIKLYKRILQSQTNPYQQSAREFIGLAYEKRGQIDKAIAEYKGYLILYPKSKEAIRVRQRLAGLETARARPKKRLKKVKKRSREGTEFYGGFSQFYNRDENYTDLGGKSISRSSLSSDLDMNIRKRGRAYDIRSVFIGGYDYNFIGDGTDNEFRLNRFYIDLSDKEKVVTARAGRQSRSVGGVLGRYDGGLLMYSITPRMKINLVAGFPVESSVFEKIDTDKHFYGASFDLGTFYKHWDVNAFYISQEADGIIDRQAVGGEIRYIARHLNFFNLIDYDISYMELNTLLFVGSWTLVDKSTVNLTIDYRNSPILTTSNALQGQIVEDLSTLMQTYNEDEVRSLALDRTAVSKSATIGFTRPFKDTKFQISTDMTFSELEGTDASGGVEAVAGTGLDYFLSAQLIGTSLIKEGDTAIVGLRFSDVSTSKTLSLNLNTRYPASRALRINPRMRIDYRKSDDGVDDRWVLRPSLRTDYYWRKKRVHFEFEAGGDWTYSTIEDSRNYFLLIGYRMDF